MATPQEHSRYMPGYAQDQIKHHEMRNAENSAVYLLPVLQEMVSSAPATSTTPYPHLLDIGCGSGTITASLAKYMPAGQITATDLSPEILERAAAHAHDRGVGNITFRTADIYALPFPDASFDLVHASMVLSHLDDPVAAYGEMLRVTKPGGVVANREADLRTCSFYPELAGVRRCADLLCATMDAGGAQSAAGPKLVAWAMRAGARREQITASFGTWTYSTPEERRIWGGMWIARIRHGGMREKALQGKMITEEELDRMVEDWNQWIAAEDACYGVMHGEILIRK